MNGFIRELWDNYVTITPSASKIKAFLRLNNDTLATDCIAFQSIDVDSCGVKRISRPFLDMGYVIQRNYCFKERKLQAVHLENPFSKNAPKIFISALLLDHCSAFTKRTLLNAFECYHFSEENILNLGRQWDISYAIYKKLARESDYAAWLYAHGLRASHFTLNIDQLKNYTMTELCNKLQNLGVPLYDLGEIIKGSKDKGLRLVRTITDRISVRFEDIHQKVFIPSCYLEFSEKYVIGDKYFGGFLTDVISKRFESTNSISI